MEETNKQNRKDRFVRRDADAVKFLLLLGGVDGQLCRAGLVNYSNN